VKIKVIDGQIQLPSLIAPIATGYMIGMAALMIPMFLLMVPSMIATMSEIPGAPNPVVLAMLTPVMMAVVLVFQGVLFACAAVFGLWVFCFRGKLEIEKTND